MEAFPAMADPTAVSAANSESSLESVKIFDRSKVKPGPGALNQSSFDPLRHEDCECFWSEIDKYFYPITTQDMAFLRTMPINAYGAAGDDALLLPPSLEDKKNNGKGEGASARDRASTPGKDRATGKDGAAAKDSAMTASAKLSAVRGTSPSADLASLPNDPAVLNSYPLSQRLVAALIDEGGGGTPSSAPQRPARGAALADIESFWPGIGAEPELRAYQKALDLRVAHELKEAGILTDADIGDEVQAELRHEQWKLRDVKTGNKTRKNSVYMLIVGTELRRQAFRREHKKFMDDTEIAYLNRMIKKLKKNKKARNKYPKLLQKMFKNHPKQQRPPALQASASIAAPTSQSVGHSGSAGAGNFSGGGVGTARNSGGGSVVQGGRASSGGGGGGGGSGSGGGVVGGNGSSGGGLGVALEQRAISKSKSAKKKKKRGDSSSRAPTSNKSAANKGRGSGRDDLDLL